MHGFPRQGCKLRKRDDKHTALDGMFLKRRNIWAVVIINHDIILSASLVKHAFSRSQMQCYKTYFWNLWHYIESWWREPNKNHPRSQHLMPFKCSYEIDGKQPASAQHRIFKSDTIIISLCFSEHPSSCIKATWNLNNRVNHLANLIWWKVFIRLSGEFHLIKPPFSRFKADNVLLIKHARSRLL